MTVQGIDDLIAALEDAKKGSKYLSDWVLLATRNPSDICSPTQSMDHIIRIIPNTHWWRIEQRKRMQGYDIPNPLNGRALYTATLGLHEADAKGGTAYGNAQTACLALCAALVRAYEGADHIIPPVIEDPTNGA